MVTWQSGKVAEAGLETLQDSSGKTTLLNQGGAESGAVDAQNGQVDADLSTWIDACPITLSDADKASILAIINRLTDDSVHP